MPTEYNNELVEVFNELAINNHFNVIGSASIKRSVNYGDYDLQTIFKCKNKKKCVEKIRQHFIKLFKIAKKNKQLWVTDLKIGELNTEPLRWNQEDLVNKINKGVSFNDALLMKSTIKVDIVYFLNGRFVEITDNYYFNIAGNKNYKETTKNDIIDSISESYNEYIEQKKYFKSLKRLYAIIRLKDPDNKKLDLLLNYFNSDIGLLYRVTTEIETLILLIEGFKVKKEMMEDTLQIWKEQISSFPVKNMIQEKTTIRGILSLLKKQFELNMKYLNKDALRFMRAHKL
tara:strand:+ start:5094 stop:5954 length:861 start_codon:yes stop_codon:yes gene_type:complete